jgi:uncharacterized membrane protein YdbT with pleckstrin-like domain
MYAGAPSLLLTLWPLNDAASVSMIAAFYKALNEGMPKDIALQQTKLAYLREASGLSAHPFFWAPFIQLGNAEPIIIRSYWQHYRWMLVVVVLLLMGVGYGYSRYKKRVR